MMLQQSSIKLVLEHVLNYVRIWMRSAVLIVPSYYSAKVFAFFQ